MAMLMALLMAFTQLGRWVAVLDVSARARATDLVLLLACARFLRARVHSAHRPNRYGDRATAGQLVERWAGVVDHVVTSLDEFPICLAHSHWRSSWWRARLLAGICTSVCPKTAHSPFLGPTFSANPPLCAFWSWFCAVGVRRSSPALESGLPDWSSRTAVFPPPARVRVGSCWLHAGSHFPVRS